MKAVLISIQPKWVALIRTRLGYDNNRPLYKKRLDLRKSAPQTTPFKAYIYETKGLYHGSGNCLFNGSGKVIGEFICDYVVRHCEMGNADLAEEMSCVPREDILKYSNGKEVFGWHISDLVIYDKPKELSEFSTPCKMMERLCGICDYAVHGMDGDLIDCNTSLERPPQSWCYVEERSENE